MRVFNCAIADKVGQVRQDTQRRVRAYQQVTPSARLEGNGLVGEPSVAGSHLSECVVEEEQVEISPALFSNADPVHTANVRHSKCAFKAWPCQWHHAMISLMHRIQCAGSSCCVNQLS